MHCRVYKNMQFNAKKWHALKKNMISKKRITEVFQKEIHSSNTATTNAFLEVKLFPKSQAVWTQQPHLSQSITPSGSCLSHSLHRVSLSTQNRAGSCLVCLVLRLVSGCELSTTASSIVLSWIFTLFALRTLALLLHWLALFFLLSVLCLSLLGFSCSFSVFFCSLSWFFASLSFFLV